MESIASIIPSSPFTGPFGRPCGGLLLESVADDLAEADRIFDAALAGYSIPRSGTAADSPIRTGGIPLAPLFRHLKKYTGKRLRPALLLLAAKACGGVVAAHHTLAAVVEMIHTATLVHDDVLDEAEVRRHVATVNAGWGNKIGILLGDTLFTHAFHLTSSVDRRACEIVGAATNRVCAGELRQVCERGNLDLSESDYFAVIDGKTAALTECCGRLGALYAGASEEVAQRVANFGRNLGLAFQIADDVLDIVGDEKAAGKSLGTDLEQRKLTLPILHCLGRLPADEANSLREAIRTGDPGFRTRVVAAIERTQSHAYARRRAEEFAKVARLELECLPRSQYRATLESLADWAIRRV